MNFRMARSALNSVSMRLFSAQIIVAATALVVNIFSARTLGPEARGELAFFMQVAYVANAVSVLGRHRAYLKLDGGEPVGLPSTLKDIRALSRAPLAMSVLIAGTVAFIVGGEVTSGLVFAIGLFTLIYSGVQQKTFRASAIVSQKAFPYFLGTLAGQSLLLVGAMFLAWFDITSLPLWLIVYGVSVIFPYLIVSLVFTARSGDLPSEDWRIGEVKTLGWKLMPMSAAEIVGARTDRFLIPVLANFAQLGIYTVVVTMTELIAWPVKNYTDSKVPQWARDILKGRFKLAREIMIVSIGILVLSLVIGWVLERILTPLFGREFEAGVELVWPLVIAAALHAFVHFGTNLSLAAGYTYLVNVIPITGMIASTASYFVFIPLIGALGAAWGLVFGYSVAVVISIVGFVKIARLN